MNFTEMLFQFVGRISEKMDFTDSDGKQVYIVMMIWAGGNKSFVMSREKYQSMPEEGTGVKVRGTILFRTGKEAKLSIEGCEAVSEKGR